MKPTDLTTTGGNDQFYPTPASVAGKMLAGVDFDKICTVLEPSAGKGDLIDALLRRFYASRGYTSRTLDIDACEIDPYLRQICKYRFSEEALSELYDRYRPLDNMAASARTEAQKQEYAFLRREIEIINAGELHVVHDDFLSFWTYKHYDLIIMNPPFANGDQHLLKAIEMQRRGGSIVCLLNAETIRNPYTATRKKLIQELQRYTAKVETLYDAFSIDAERRASVDVAIVRVDIEAPREESTIWERMKKAVIEEDMPDPELHALVSADYLEAAIQQYKAEVSATMELIRQYRALSPYMTRSLTGDHSLDKSPILSLVVTDDNYLRGLDLKKYMRLVRLKYWEALFSNKEFTGKLTSDLQKTYRENVSRMADYEFSAFNIKQVLLEMNASITQGVEDAIMKLFEELTVEHSWYPECKNNRHYFDGWATNKAHKIGKKCIIPTWGMFSTYSWSDKAFDVSRAYAVISDLEKAFDYLDGGETSEINLQLRLQRAAEAGQTRNIECKYFKIDLYKKGTTHIKFYPESMKLVDKLNIYAAQNRKWLPPNYGKASYTDMDEPERAVVDSFHGDGTEGSGERAYAEVLARKDYYLAAPVPEMRLLQEGA